MKELLNKLEIITNNLNFTKSKIKYPTLHKPEDYEFDLLRQTEEEFELRKEAEKIMNINNYKNSIISQLNEYIIKLEKNIYYPFSIKQNLTAPMFYLSPLIDVKRILLTNENGISLPILVLTLDEKDAVKNKSEFLIFLKEVRNDFSNATDLYNLFILYKNFEKILIKNFC